MPNNTRCSAGMFSNDPISPNEHYKKRQNSQSLQTMLQKKHQIDESLNSLQQTNNNASSQNPPSSSSDTIANNYMAETLQACYSLILDLEKKNQQYNVSLNQSIYQLSQLVKLYLSSTSPSFQRARVAEYRQQAIDKHIFIQKTLANAYTNNLELLDAYYDFILFALRGKPYDGVAPTSASNGSSSNIPNGASGITAGYQILHVYKISRRLWIYGIINLLENMKNLISISQAIPPETNSNNIDTTSSNSAENASLSFHIENELCVNFISHCFSLLSTLVEMHNDLSVQADLQGHLSTQNACLLSAANTTTSSSGDSALSTLSLISEFQNWWFEKIADLSRMSIALYPSSFINWEISAEHWYLKTFACNYGHGKTLYHLATVQQPNSNSNSSTIDPYNNSTANANNTAAALAAAAQAAQAQAAVAQAQAQAAANGGAGGAQVAQAAQAAQAAAAQAQAAAVAAQAAQAAQQHQQGGTVSAITAAANSANLANNEGNLNVSLEALFNLGKAVFVKDCFVPTGHYLRMVLDSMFLNSRISSPTIYESSLLHLTSGNGTIMIDQRNVTTVDNVPNWELIILQYIRISKVLLVGNFNSSPDLIKLVLNFARSFGSIDFVTTTSTDSSDNDLFINNDIYMMDTSNLLGGNSSGHHHHHQQQPLRVSFFEKDNGTTLNLATTTAVNNVIDSPHVKTTLIEKPSIKLLNFWFNKAGNLALINIWQLVGFGVLNFKNLFSILFELPLALKERQERKENKKNRRNKDQKSEDSNSNFIANNNNSAAAAAAITNTTTPLTTSQYESLLDDPYPLASQMSTIKWYESLQFINKSSVELSFRTLKKFLNCPFKSVSTPHIIVWLYYLIALGKATDINKECEPVVLDVIFKKFFPWESLINYLNFWVNETRECFDFDDLESGFKIMDSLYNNKKNKADDDNYEDSDDDFIAKNNLLLEIRKLYALGNDSMLQHFNKNETLIEVWKLWGSLWFNLIDDKQNYVNINNAGWKGKDFLGDYINKTEEMLYIYKPDVNSQENIQRLQNTNANYFRDLFSEGDNCDRTNNKMNFELHEKEKRFERLKHLRNLAKKNKKSGNDKSTGGSTNGTYHENEKLDRRLFNNVEKERIKRILLLAIYIAQKYPKFGLCLTDRFFKWKEYICATSPSDNSLETTGNSGTPGNISHPDDIRSMSSNAPSSGSNFGNDMRKNTLIFEFVTDSRFANLFENISEQNVHKAGSDKNFNVNTFFRSSANYAYLVRKQIERKKRLRRKAKLQQQHQQQKKVDGDNDIDISGEDDDMDANDMEHDLDEDEYDDDDLDDLDYEEDGEEDDDEDYEYDDEFDDDKSMLTSEYVHPQEPSIIMDESIRNNASNGIFTNSLISQEENASDNETPRLKYVHVPFIGNIANDIDASITYVTFDTNSWLKNCGKIYKIFKSCTLNDSKSLKLRIALPLLVYQELRSLRKLEDSYLSDSATRCVITIKNMYNDNFNYYKKNYNKKGITSCESSLLLLKMDGGSTHNLNDNSDILEQQQQQAQQGQGVQSPILPLPMAGKSIDDMILTSVLNSAKQLKGQYLTALQEKYKNVICDHPYLEFGNVADPLIKPMRIDGLEYVFDTPIPPPQRLFDAENRGGVQYSKRLDSVDIYGFKFNILITDNRPLRLKARSMGINSFQNKWLFYNLEKINLENSCLD